MRPPTQRLEHGAEQQKNLPCLDGIVRLLGLAARLAFAALQVTDFHVLFVFLREPAVAALFFARVLRRLANGLAARLESRRERVPTR